jgi:GDP-L-fucose synthase
MNPANRIFVAGHRGMVGSALMRRLQKDGYNHLICRSHADLDLTDQSAVTDFFKTETVDVVFLAAAKVGGIHANNTLRADYLYENLMIQANVIHGAFNAGIERLLFLGSSCIYPAACPQPMQEEHLLTGALEPTNEAYGVAKIAGIKLCESYNRQYGTQYRAVMPSNLYGPNDSFDLMHSHVLPAMIRKFHLAKLADMGDNRAIAADEACFGPLPADTREMLTQENVRVRLWGSGTPRREFLHVEDMASACMFVMQMSDRDYQRACQLADAPSGQVYHLNVGRGDDTTINELSGIIASIVGYKGAVEWDASMPDGMTRKVLDVSRLKGAGWQASIALTEGIKSTYQWYLKAGGRTDD